MGDLIPLRVLVATAAVTAVTAAVVMRRWDRAAGKRVAELTRARVRDEWRADERIAELEMDLDESHEVRKALEAKLRAKRAELARLRNEHADLLRRYATAETERASALEGRRLLALTAATPARALPTGTDRPDTALRDANGAPTAEAYRKAMTVLSELVRNAARQQVKQAVEEARRRDLADGRQTEEEPRGRHAVIAEEDDGSHKALESRDTDAVTAAGSRRKHSMTPAAAVVPYAPQRRPVSRPTGSFDFFGTQSGKREPAEHKPAELPASSMSGAPAMSAGLRASAGSGEEVHRIDMAGAQIAAERETEAQTDAERQREVIDLTEHDETEQLDVRQLRVRSS